MSKEEDFRTVSAPNAVKPKNHGPIDEQKELPGKQEQNSSVTKRMKTGKRNELKKKRFERRRKDRKMFESVIQETENVMTRDIIFILMMMQN
jgi:hypothetical protein